MKGIEMTELALRDFCAVIDGTMTPELCEQLISLFENNPELHQRFDLNKTPNFTQLNFTQHSSIDTALHNKVVDHLIAAVQVYRKNVPETFFWKPGFSFEQVRIKKYLNDGNDLFDTHVDASSSETMKRFFAFFWYLNDVDEGGETEFLNLDLKVKPKAGRLVMFPPMWMYPHKGHPPISNNKYLLSTYLHFS
jgi:hypothetical protein